MPCLFSVLCRCQPASAPLRSEAASRRAAFSRLLGTRRSRGPRRSERDSPLEITSYNRLRFSRALPQSACVRPQCLVGTAGARPCCARPRAPRDIGAISQDHGEPWQLLLNNLPKQLQEACVKYLCGRAEQTPARRVTSSFRPLYTCLLSPPRGSSDMFMWESLSRTRAVDLGILRAEGVQMRECVRAAPGCH